jgi:hypothetical protein
VNLRSTQQTAPELSATEVPSSRPATNPGGWPPKLSPRFKMIVAVAVGGITQRAPAGAEWSKPR